METPIAARLRESHTRSWLALIIAMGVLIGDFVTCSLVRAPQWPRLLLAAVGAFVVAYLSGGDRKTLGLIPRPVQGYRYWLKAGLLIGVSVLGFCLLAAAVLQTAGWSVPLPMLSPQEAPSFAIMACVKAPLLEEVLYRFVLCLPLVAIAGPKYTVAVGGTTFAALHFAYGNPAPDNFIAGFFLCWAYLKSGSLLVPLLFHSIGNAFVMMAHLANWYWTQ